MAAFEEDVINALIDWVEATEPTLAGKVALSYPSEVHETQLPTAALTHLRTIPAEDTSLDQPSELSRTATQATLRTELAMLRLEMQLDVFTGNSTLLDRITSNLMLTMIATPRTTTADGRGVRLIFQESVSHNAADMERRTLDFAAEAALTRDEAFYLVSRGIGTVKETGDSLDVSRLDVDVS